VAAVALGAAAGAHEDHEPIDFTLVGPVLGPGTGAAAIVDPRDLTEGVSLSLHPEEVGRWSPLIANPRIGVNAALLPTGEVLFFGVRPEPLSSRFDPVTHAVTDVPPPQWSPSCTGHVFLPDGRLLVTGGRDQVQDLGYPHAYVYDPFTHEWQEQVGDHRRGRFYPTNVILGDGRVVSMSGYMSTAGHGLKNDDIEIWDPLDQGNWELVAERELPWYPLLHLMEDGTLFLAGPGRDTDFFDPDTAAWTPVGPRTSPRRYFAPSILLPPNNRRVLVVGGNNGSQTGGGVPVASAELIDFGSFPFAWRETAPMGFARQDHSSVVLPDATVLIVGGKSTHLGPANSGKAVFYPEVFDPATETWSVLAPHRHPRKQHSTALLLPDARVLVAGRPQINSLEIFSPPYLFRGERPVLVSAPDEIPFRGTMQLELTSPTRVNRLVLMRLSSVTHSVSFGQRYVDLGTVQGTGSIAVSTPDEPDEAPPGYYMLFAVSADGVPSVSKILRLAD